MSGTSGLTDAQKREIAAIVAAALHQHSAATPASVAQSSSMKSTVAKPREYSGGDDYQHFRRECLVYIATNAAQFSNDAKKAMLVLSYMKGGQAASWAQNYIEAYTAADGTITIPNAFAAFLAELDRSFDDPNKKEKALAALRKLTQGNMTADEFSSSSTSFVPRRVLLHHNMTKF